MPKIPMAEKAGLIRHVSDTVHMTGAPPLNWKLDEGQALIDMGDKLGRGAEKLGNAMMAFGQHMQDTEDRLNATRIESLWKDRQSALETRMAENPGEYEKFSEWARETDTDFVEASKPFREKMRKRSLELFDARMDGIRKETYNRRRTFAVQARVTADYNLFQSQWKDAALRSDLDTCNMMLEEHRGTLISEQEYAQKKLDYHRLADFATARRAVEANELDIDKKIVEKDKDGRYVNYKHLTLAEREQLHRTAVEKQDQLFKQGYEDAQKMRIDGTLTPEKIKELYDNKKINARLYLKLRGELATETKENQRNAYIEFGDYIEDRLFSNDNKTAEDLGQLRGSLDQLVQSGKLDPKHALSLQSKIDIGLKKLDMEAIRKEARRASECKKARNELVDRALLHIGVQAFYRAKGGEFDTARLDMERQIRECPNLTAAEQKKLLAKIQEVGDADDLFKSANGKRVEAWLLDHIDDDGNVNGLYYEKPGWFNDIEDQELQRKAFDELREFALAGLYGKKDPMTIISELEQRKKQLRDKGVNDAIAAAIVKVHGTNEKDYSTIPSLFDAKPKPDAAAPAAKTLSGMLDDLGKEEFGGKGKDKQEEQKK